MYTYKANHKGKQITGQVLAKNIKQAILLAIHELNQAGFPVLNLSIKRA